MSMEHVTSTGKDTIYVDVDDEITTIIDKVRSSHARIIALVLPKRAPVLQSIVNMKLLKRNAETAKKHLVLITSEAGLLPLAGSVEMYVAKTLQSKPEVPPAPELPGHHGEEDEDEAVHMDDEAPAATTKGAKSTASTAAKEKEKLDVGKSVGELAAGSIAAEAVDEAIDLDNDSDELDAGDTSATKTKGKAKKPKGEKKLRIPNFNKFRLMLVLGGVGFVGLIVLLIVCVKVLPKASITIDTDRQAVNISPTLTLSTTASSVNTGNSTLPAQSQQTQKTLTAQVPTTGQQNNGQKATGTVTLSAQECNSFAAPSDVPSGSGITTSVNGQTLTFVTQGSTSFSGTPNINHKTNCITYPAGSSTSVASQNGGSVYNVGASSFTVSGRSDVTASSSSAMTGGTDSIIQIVAQADVDSATAKLGTVDTNAVKQQLQSALQAASEYPIPASFTTGTPATTPSAQVGAQATTLTLTQTTTYAMLGVKQSDLQQVIKAGVGQQVNIAKQSIVDYGLSSASFSQQNAVANGMTLSLQDTAVVGAMLDTKALAKEVAGKKTPEATSIIKSNPGVTNVTVKYSPFWVMSVPNNASKITIHIDQPKTVSNG